MTLSLLPDSSAWRSLAHTPHLLSTHPNTTPEHDVQLLATLDRRPCAAFLLRARAGALDCVASASIDTPQRPLLFCALIPYARAHGASSLSMSLALAPPPSSPSPDAYAQQLPFDPLLFTPTLLALTLAGASPSPGWAPLPNDLILARLTLDTSP